MSLPLSETKGLHHHSMQLHKCNGSCHTTFCTNYKQVMILPARTHHMRVGK
ncbi:hypothetical protein CIPAW_05G015800 [Carya illinoinensis]|uniref:Uncharacterized protein n=1 Tax=Carya illinoinensis TaxID=32201 RepID=A0A8T1QDW5_CARIL|nr:hypothetical protein CIPAW_05G015800 [Carya illinoinensis]